MESWKNVVRCNENGNKIFKDKSLVDLSKMINELKGKDSWMNDIMKKDFKIRQSQFDLKKRLKCKFRQALFRLEI
jgi:hypothetical protein